MELKAIKNCFYFACEFRTQPFRLTLPEQTLKRPKTLPKYSWLPCKRFSHSEALFYNCASSILSTLIKEISPILTRTLSGKTISTVQGADRAKGREGSAAT